MNLIYLQNLFAEDTLHREFRSSVDRLKIYTGDMDFTE